MTARQPRVIGVPVGTHVTTAATPEENSKFMCGQTDLMVLLDEVYNSSIRAVCVYGRVGSMVLEDGTVVPGMDDSGEDALDDAFTDEDMTALCTVLPYNHSLLAVNINGVVITDAGVVELCRALKYSRVRLLDLTNTVLDDESGVALLELAQSNIHVRTIVVDDTMIAESLMDDIDMACLNNEATVPRLPPLERIDPERVRYCVGNIFNVCGDGVYCVAGVHGFPPLRRAVEEDKKLKEAARTQLTFESVVAAAARSQREMEELQRQQQIEQQQQQQQKQREREREQSQQPQQSVVAPPPVAAPTASKPITRDSSPFLTPLLIGKGLVAMTAASALTWLLLRKLAK